MRGPLSRIAHKHASLGITSGQCKLVHQRLFAAIGDVLGDAVTPEAAAAWDEVYWPVANALVALEARLDQEAGTVEGGAWRQLDIVERHEETRDAVSLLLRPTDGAPAGAFRPGQYVSVRSNSPTAPAGYAHTASPAHRRTRAGASPSSGCGPERARTARCRPGCTSTPAPATRSASPPPFGDFVVPDGDGSLLPASAGIGIAPMLPMLHQLAATGTIRRVVVMHADRTPADHAHRDEQRRLVASLPNARLHLWCEEPGAAAPEVSPGRADVFTLDLPDEATAYLCGPLSFMRAVRGDLLRRGLPAHAVHYEVVGPDLRLGGAWRTA